MWQTPMVKCTTNTSRRAECRKLLAMGRQAKSDMCPMACGTGNKQTLSGLPRLGLITLPQSQSESQCEIRQAPRLPLARLNTHPCCRVLLCIGGSGVFVVYKCRDEQLGVHCMW